MPQPGVVLVIEQKVINVQSAFPIFPSFQNFSIVGTQAQTVFILPSYPVLSGMFILNINGVMQDPLNGDYTVNGDVVTLDAGVNLGDKVAGFYQEMAANMNPAVLNYATFFFTATQGQTTFNLGFVPTSFLYIAVNGVFLSANQYAQNGPNIILTQALNAGDKFLGLATKSN